MRLFGDQSEAIADEWLRMAFRLAERGRGRTNPNPLVGAVVVSGSKIVGRGYHEKAGRPHAEVLALEDAGELAQGAHMAVTMEPCNHRGRTPPCTEAIIAAGVASVDVGMRDPNPGVVGGGADRLRAAGIAVRLADDESPFREQNEAWVHWLETGTPWVRVKVALTLDGKPAIERGVRTRITGRGGDRVTMRLRAVSDAVAIGAGTLAADDPALTVRGDDGAPTERQPLRVVISRLTIPDVGASMFSDAAGPVTVLMADTASLADAGSLHGAGADVFVYPEAQGLGGAMSALGREGVTSVLVEPGPGLFAALWDDDLMDELFVLHAGGVAGGAAPGLYEWRAGDAGTELERRLRPVESGIEGETAVTGWRRTSGPAK